MLGSNENDNCLLCLVANMTVPPCDAWKYQ
jgi:hypothetical protein